MANLYSYICVKLQNTIYIYIKILYFKLLKDCDKKPLAWWRYIDDIFMLWQHSEKELEKFLVFGYFINSSVYFSIIISP